MGSRPADGRAGGGSPRRGAVALRPRVVADQGRQGLRGLGTQGSRVRFGEMARHGMAFPRRRNLALRRRGGLPTPVARRVSIIPEVGAALISASFVRIMARVTAAASVRMATPEQTVLLPRLASFTICVWGGRGNETLQRLHEGDSCVGRQQAVATPRANGLDMC